MLTIDRLNKIFANSRDGISGGIRDARLSLPSGNFLTLLGPSGCGKTTTLRCVAGLETPDSGKIEIDDVVLFDDETNISIPMNARNIGMVFQSYAIWPHMTVFDNVAFPLQVAREFNREQIRRRVEEALARVDLAGFETRSATRLSGGQQQRVALARAIVRKPRLLLLDEPLSNLDAALREGMRKELKSLQKQLGITAIYVTHDQDEALALSDLIAVVNQGRIVQTGTPQDIYFRPTNPFVARFVGATNLIAGTAVAGVVAGALGAVKLGSGETLRATFSTAAAEGDKITLSVRPEVLRLVSDHAGGTLHGTVKSTVFQGAISRCDVACGDATVNVVLDYRATIEPGSAVALHADPADVIAFTV